MPIYEFICQNCRRKSSFLIRDTSSPIDAKCSFCGSADLSRTISSFAYHKSMKTIWEESGESQRPSPDYYQDPRNIGRWAEDRFKEMDLEMPPQLQEEIQAAREGEMPESLKEL